MSLKGGKEVILWMSARSGFHCRNTLQEPTFFVHPPLLYPREGQDFESPFEYLVTIAEPEQWNLPSSPYKGRFPILRNYLDHTFRRLLKLDLIAYSDDGIGAAFNTGLQNSNGQNIFAVLRKNFKSEASHSENWFFHRFCDSYSDLLDPFRSSTGELPQMAHYITNPASLIFDPNLRIEANYDHIYRDNKDRLPEKIADNQYVSVALIDHAIKRAQQMVRRNYKVAIPVWYHDEIDLLLPGYLLGDGKPDVAFVADKVEGIYKIRTIFTMEMAYNNARLIAKPDRDWLNP